MTALGIELRSLAQKPSILSLGLVCTSACTRVDYKIVSIVLSPLRLSSVFTNTMLPDEIDAIIASEELREEMTRRDFEHRVQAEELMVTIVELRRELETEKE